jgi:hypothetical protein
MAISYTLKVDNQGKILVKTTDNKQDFHRIVMLYAVGNYNDKLKVYNEIVQKAEKIEEKQLLKSKEK